MSFVNTINWHKLVNILSDVKDCIYISLPGIDEELAELLIRLKREKNTNIKICIDNSEDTIRNGYGEVKGIDNLIENGITIRECKGNRVSFIIVDNSGYIFFPESRIFSADPTGPNAIKLDGFTISRLLNYFFPPADDDEREVLDERFSNSIEGHKEWMHKVRNEVFNDPPQVVTEEFDKSEYAKTKASLIKNPPIEPDLQRQIKTYNAKVQFAELRFSGGRIQNMLVEFPKKGLPIQDEKLKELLKSRIKLINNDDFLKENKSIESLQARVEKLRKDYLIPLTHRENKSILIKERKTEFLNEFAEIEKSIENANQSLPSIVIKAMDETKELVKNNLIDFFANFPTKEQSSFADPSVRKYQIESDITKIISSIKFPPLQKLAQHFSLKVNFYDLTWDDFKDNELLEEFSKRKILTSNDIKEIVDLKDALEAKR